MTSKWKFQLFSHSFIISLSSFQQFSFSFQPPVHLWQFLWLHFLAINLLHLHPVQAPFPITWLHDSVYTGVDQRYWGPPALAMPVVHLADNQASAFPAFSLPNSAALHSLSSPAATLTEGSKWGLDYVQHLINVKYLPLKIHPIVHCSGFGEITAGESCGDSCQTMQRVAIVLIALYSHLQMKDQMWFLLISLFSGRCSSKSLQLGAESFDRKKPNGAGTAGDGEETCSRKWRN